MLRCKFGSRDMCISKEIMNLDSSSISSTIVKALINKRVTSIVKILIIKKMSLMLDLLMVLIKKMAQLMKMNGSRRVERCKCRR